jgi:ribosomal protein S18 acetylase RimI-like enzyme
MFEQFDQADLTDWFARSNAEYIEERMASGDTLEEARANARASMERTFPGGVTSPKQRVGRLVLAGEPIGELWIGQFGDDPERWWVWNVRIDEQFRGRGLGRGAMLLAEELARAGGAVTLGLNVFAHNIVARSLYSSLGYREAAIQMRKDLTSNPADP